ncbi:mRNA-decapping enzyme 1A [Engraulis encrasicolus]|uniref:mRNA-decapping enzyme 1A n=1 Tax=Engraulis encrasicolus TaxID=184585 RepID=UPI002FD6DA79
MESVNKAGHLMSLAALQQYDPYINRLLDLTGQVALYTFNSKANEWEKTDIEGTLFVYARSASPYHGFTIMNRLSTENLVEPINKDLEFQLQDPFLLYRNANLGIYSIWFYDKTDCQRIAQLMVRIVKEEAMRAQLTSPERAMVGRTNGCVETRPIDILELLSKAKEEYNRGQSADSDPPRGMNAGQKQDAGKSPTVPPSAQDKSTTHTVVKQITVEELFGTLPKDPAPTAPPPAIPPAQSAPDSSSSLSQPPSEGFMHGRAYAPAAPPMEPLLTPRLAADPGGTHDRPLIPGLVSLLQHPPPPTTTSTSREPQQVTSVSPRLVAPSTGSDPPLAALGPPNAPPSAPPAYMGTPSKADGHGITIAPLAPSFLSNSLVTPQSFRDPVPKPPAAFGSMPTVPVQPNKEVDMFAQSQSLVKNIPQVPLKSGLVVAGTELSLLLSPSAFQHSISKTTDSTRGQAPPSSPPANLGSTEQHPPPHPPPHPAAAGAMLSKHQLQDTLVHLIKNDPSFLSAIHEAYMQSLSKDLNNMKL